MSTKIVPTKARDAFANLRRSNPNVIQAEKRLGGKLTLARNLMRLRVQRGFTQTALAKRAGVSQPRIAEIEGGRANPQYDSLLRLASALGVRIESLVTERHAASNVVSVEKSLHLPARPGAGEGWEDASAVQAVVDATAHFEGPRRTPGFGRSSRGLTGLLVEENGEA